MHGMWTHPLWLSAACGLAAFLLGLSGCSQTGPAPTPRPNASPTPRPSATRFVPTPRPTWTHTATRTAVPTETPAPPTATATPTVILPTPTAYVFPTAAAPLDGSFVFIQDGDLFWYSDGNITQLTEGPPIFAFDYHPETGRVAYIVGYEQPADYNTAQLAPTHAHLVDLSTGQYTQILELPTQWFPHALFVRELEDVGFSPDGSLLAITSSESLWVYELASGQLSQVFSFPVTEGVFPEVYAYENPLISPDHRYVILKQLYMEGGHNALADLSSPGQVTKLSDFLLWVGGKEAVAWLSPDRLLVEDKVESSTDARGYQVSIQIVGFPDLAMIQSFDFTGGALALTTRLHQGAAFVLFQIFEPSDEVRGNYRVYYDHRYLYRLDLDTGERTLLYDLIGTQHSNSSYLSNFVVLNDEALVLEIRPYPVWPQPRVTSLYVLDLSAPDRTPGLIAVNALLTPER